MTHRPERRAGPGPSPDPGRDVLITLPSGWTRHLDPRVDVLVAARAGVLPASGVRPVVVLRCEPVDEHPVAWQRRALTALARRLDAFAMEEHRLVERGGAVVVHHRYAHRRDGHDLVVDRWARVDDGIGLTLTGTAAREDHRAWGEVFAAVADTVALVPALPRSA